MAFRAVSAPMLRSEPGTLLETVAGTMTMGTQNSSYFPRAVNNSSRDRKACRAEPRALVFARGEGSLWQGGLEERSYLPQGRGTGKSGWCQGEEPDLSQRTAAKQTGTTPASSLSLSPILTHPAVHMKLIYLHISQENKAGEHLDRMREMAGERKSRYSAFPVKTKSSCY